MKDDVLGGKELDQYLGCYGSFTAEDPFCQKQCVLSLSRAIEKDHHSRLEPLEDLMRPDGYIPKMQ